ncbi:MAG: sugar phosphate isomerase/epimerase family protein, partial [Gemmataceae bacterium]
WYGVNLDTGNFKTADPYGDLAKIAPFAVNAQVKTEIFPGGRREEADLGRLIGILRRADYGGYVALEYEAKEEPREAVPGYVEKLRKLLG